MNLVFKLLILFLVRYIINHNSININILNNIHIFRHKVNKCNRKIINIFDNVANKCGLYLSYFLFHYIDYFTIFKRI